MPKKTVATIIKQGHGYIVTVKGNQPTLCDAIALKSQTPARDAWSWQQTGHGHDARCRIKVWPADPQITESWAGMKQYISVRRRGEREGKPFDSTTYYATSETLSAWCLAKRIRGHRKVENTLHWTKDVVLEEDDCGLTESQSAANMAVLRNINFNLLVMSGYKSISEGMGSMGAKIGKMWKMISQPCEKPATL